MDFIVPAGMGVPVGNILRQVAIAGSPVWRPIAFKLNRKFNLIEVTSVVQDNYMIMASLSKLSVAPSKQLEGDLVTCMFSFVGELRPTGMACGEFSIVGKDEPIITSMDDFQIELTVYFRLSTGVNSVTDNSSFLAPLADTTELTVMTSRHTDVEKFSFVTKPSVEGFETLSVVVESLTRSERAVLGDSVRSLSSLLETIEKNL